MEAHAAGSGAPPIFRSERVSHVLPGLSAESAALGS